MFNISQCIILFDIISILFYFHLIKIFKFLFQQLENISSLYCENVLRNIANFERNLVPLFPSLIKNLKLQLENGATKSRAN